jgi:DNA-binding CsgD family transcriptional regulator
MSHRRIDRSIDTPVPPNLIDPGASIMPALPPSPELIVGSISDVVEVIDARGVITYTNSPESNHLFYGLDQVLGQKCHLVYEKVCPSCVECPLDEVFSSAKPITVESPVNMPEGGGAWVRQHLYPIMGVNGKVSGVLRMVFDITRDKQEQAKEEKYLDSLEQSLYNRTGDFSPATVQPLSARELEVLSYIADGLSNREIARLLDISRHTVKTHVGHIFNKLGVTDRTQAAVTALRLNILG